MPYQPMTADRSADYIFEGLQQAEKQRFASEEASKARVADSLQKSNKQAMEAGMMFAENIAKQKNNVGKLEGLAALGALPQEDLDKLSAIKDPDKLAGALGAAEHMIAMRQQSALIKERAAAQAALTNGELASDRTGQTTTLTDPVTGKKYGAFFQNNRQVAPFDVPDAPVQTSATRVDLGNGMFAYVDSRGRPIPKSAIQESVTDPVQKARQTALETERAKLTGEISTRGADAKDGLNWWPWSDTLGDRLKKTESELQSLQGGEGVQPPGPSAATPPTITSKADFDALPSGTVYIGKDGKRYKKP